ncbi:MAG: hypothetical protein U5L09_01325 [Bacteroidales bacterium]|nr:hypothetical protein [Bacteroidales bacterium]
MGMPSGYNSPASSAGVFPAIDIGNLCRSECYYVICLVSTKIGVKIVEVSAGSTNDNYIFLVH